MHVFGRWEEAGVAGENPRTHGENMHTEMNLEPSCSDGAHHNTTVRPPFFKSLFSNQNMGQEEVR